MIQRRPDDSATARRLTVLVTDGSYKHAVGIIRSLGRAGHKVTTVSDFRLAPGFFSRWTNAYACVRSPEVDPKGFIVDLLNSVAAWRVDLVIPVGYSSVAAISRSVDAFEKLGAQVVAPSAELFDLASDKWQMIEQARTAGINVPETVLIDTDECIARFLEKQSCGSGIVIKYRYESVEKGVAYLSPGSDINSVLRQRPIGRAPDGRSDTIAQEYITGTGTGYMALVVHGQIVREFAHRRRREIPPEGGASTAAESVYDQQVLAAGRTLMEAIRWHGPAMAEFRINESGCYLIEFNPKFWGSLELALAAGADFPGDLCRLAAGEDLTQRPIPDYRQGLRYWWPWRGDLRRLLKRPRDLGVVLGDLLNPRTRSNWWWHDLMPNLIEMGGEFTYPLRRRKRPASKQSP